MYLLLVMSLSSSSHHCHLIIVFIILSLMSCHCHVWQKLCKCLTLACWSWLQTRASNLLWEAVNFTTKRLLDWWHGEMFYLDHTNISHVFGWWFDYHGLGCCDGETVDLMGVHCPSMPWLVAGCFSLCVHHLFIIYHILSSPSCHHCLLYDSCHLIVFIFLISSSSLSSSSLHHLPHLIVITLSSLSSFLSLYYHLPLCLLHHIIFLFLISSLPHFKSGASKVVGWIFQGAVLCVTHEHVFICFDHWHYILVSINYICYGNGNWWKFEFAVTQSRFMLQD